MVDSGPGTVSFGPSTSALIPPMALSQALLDDMMIVFLVALIGLLLLREVIKAAAGGVGMEKLTPALLLVGLTGVSLLVMKFLSIVR